MRGSDSLMTLDHPVRSTCRHDVGHAARPHWLRRCTLGMPAGITWAKLAGLLGWLLLGANWGIKARAGESESQARFIERYVERVAGLRDQLEDVSGSYTRTVSRPRKKPGRATDSKRVRFARCDGQVRAVYTRQASEASDAGSASDRSQSGSEERPYYETADGYNKRYSFSLTKATSSSPYVLRDFEPVTDRAKKSIDRAFWPVDVCAANIIAYWQRRAALKVTRITEDKSRGERRLTVDFSVELKPDLDAGAKRKRPSLKFRSGSFCALPDRGWALERYLLRLEMPGGKDMLLRSAEIEYRDARDTAPLPSRVRMVDRALAGVKISDWADADGARGEVVTEELYTFTDLALTRTRDRDFTLSAFGFPQMDRPGRRYADHTPYWLFGVATAAGLGVLALRRHQAKSGRG